jgi:hypothetical protein
MSPLVSAILFAAVASPATYKLTRSIGGDWIATSEGTAKMGGLILHAIVFVLLSMLVWGMLNPKSSAFRMRRKSNWGTQKSNGVLQMD